MITIVAAIARGGAIGKGGTLPWHYPEDLAHFKALTMGHAVVMGRRTWDSLPPRFKPLPGRKNIILSRYVGTQVVSEENDFSQPVIEHDAEAFFRRDARDLMVIGGAEVYAQALPLASALEITEVDVDVEGADAFFPSSEREFRARPPGAFLRFGNGVWFREVSCRKGKTPELTFVRWERVR